MFGNWDYINLGANGFAQVGDPNYSSKNEIEMEVVLEAIKEQNPIPEEFKGMCRIGVKRFSHEFGFYHEVVLHYDCDEVQNMEDTDEEKHDRFWEFANKLESFDFEDTDIGIKIAEKFAERVRKGDIKYLHIVKNQAI